MAKRRSYDVTQEELSRMSLEELAATRRSIAETVNRQMRRWVKEYGDNTPSAYEKAQEYLKRQGLSRFSTGKSPLPAKTPAAQKRRELAQINQMLAYRNMKSYSIEGYREVKSKALEGFKRATKSDITDEQAEILLKSQAFGWLKRTVGSPILLDVARAIAQGQAPAEEVKKKMNAVFEQYSESEDTEKAFKNKPIDDVFKMLGLDIDAVLFQNEDDEEDGESLTVFDFVDIKKAAKKAAKNAVKGAKKALKGAGKKKRKKRRKK